MEDQVLAVLRASPARRVFGVGTLAALGVLLAYVSMARPPANLALQVFLLILGALALWWADRMRRATRLTIELTETELRSSNGDKIALVSQVVAMDRGMFAFKPSNGFMLKTSQASPITWQPGLWWCLGHRVGVGGVTPGAQTKVMADILSALIARGQVGGQIPPS